MWNESPRIRHQLAWLLQSNGHQVTFVEKCQRFASSFNVTERDENGIKIITHDEFCHHQLKPVALIQKIYNYYTSIWLSKISQECVYDVIINFNYDYSFLRNIFIKSKIITIINDDFEAQAKPWMRSAISEQLKKTCEMSDAVLAVSYPLLNRVKKHSNESHLFLPWCEDKYINPNKNEKRDVVLYFGFINHRIDWNIVFGLLAKGIKLRFVGPINETKSKHEINKLSENKNFEYLSARDFNELNLDDVCCSIAPYNMNIESIKACTISNRAFRLLSRGIPVIYPPLPYILAAPIEVISTAADIDEYAKVIEMYKNNFDECQEKIRNFLPEHSANKRYSELLAIF